MLKKIAFVGCFLILVMFGKTLISSVTVNFDRVADTEKQQIAARAQPLLAALERYRAEKGFYPPSLDRLPRKYLASRNGLPDFLYSAEESDWIKVASAECAARERSLHGLTLEQTTHLEQRGRQFQADCVAGYRNYRLQSEDVHVDPSTSLERWAYYSSSSKSWGLGWCSHEVSSQTSDILKTASNGVCRW